ncbi:MAG: ABC transporter permease [Chlorobi bacterium]|nr:ABC transporter permease [Chlorobiota bacterium]
MLAIKLAYRNLIGAGLRTWLNVFVLSLSYVLIIYFNGLMDGFNIQAKTDTIAWEIGDGVYWHKNYNAYDPFTLEEGHGIIPESLNYAVNKGTLSPILISQATIYPDGRLQSVLLKGIGTEQKVLKIPSQSLSVETEEIPALIGKRMAANTKLKKDDVVTLRWRDAQGTFDAAEIKIVNIFDSNVPTIDMGQIWIPLKEMQKMKQMPDEATIIVKSKEFNKKINDDNWVFKGHTFLLEDITKLIKTKKIGSSFFYIIIMALAMLAIFDTQVLSIFRRQKEIGTYIALGMTRSQVVGLFTVEGSFHAILAAIVGAVYGIPLLMLQAINGYPIPEGADNMGIAVGKAIYPVYGLGLVISTIIIVFLITTIVSYLPARKISKMNPTDAIKGKIQ